MIVDVNPQAIELAEKLRKKTPKRFWPECCHIACAVKQQIPKAHVSVGIAMLTVKYPDGDTHYFNLPPEGLEVVRQADFHEEVQPVVFEAIPVR